ncbi:hypothetical protein Hanom_Chr08g00724061 [Helianthus anomalus]
MQVCVVPERFSKATDSIIRTSEPDAEPKVLIALVDPEVDLVKLIDHGLGDNYFMVSVHIVRISDYGRILEIWDTVEH